MSTVQFYWIMKLDSIRSLINGVALFGWVMGSILLIVVIFDSAFVIESNRYRADSYDYKKARSVAKIMLPKSIIILIIAFILQSVCAILPSTKEVAALIVVPKVVTAIYNSKALKQLPSRVVDIGNAYFKELSPKKNSADEESN
jgi:hypothetical protein